MDDESLRKAAISRYLVGEKVSKIVGSLKKSRAWFYKWLFRYENRDEEDSWATEQSRAPKRRKKKISKQTEERIVEIRKELAGKGFSQIGAIAIQYEFERLGYEIPKVWTINRVIAREGLNKKEKKERRNREYPDMFISTHQMDLVGPRYLRGDGRFYSINIIDVETHMAYVKAIRTKSSEEILEAVAEFWSEYGMPDSLQRDNELAFRGSNRYPRSYGSLVRFALTQGVAPLFIPVKEPYRNGIIEKFNCTYSKRFLKARIFNDFKDLSKQAEEFKRFHNEHHRYSVHNHRTPNEMAGIDKHRIQYKDDVHRKKKIPLESGSIYFIRFIRSDLKLQLPTEHFKVSESLKYAYVVAEVNIDKQTLIVRQNNEIKHIYRFITAADW